MNPYFEEMWEGPGHLRFYVQPLLALLLGIRDGVHDAREGKPPYLLSLLTHSETRRASLAEAMRRLALPLVLGIGLSMLYQQLIRGRIILVNAIAYGCIFIVLPYAVARAVVNRAVRTRLARRARA